MTALRGAPRARGYHFPAEWEPHEGTWIGWPHNRSDWPGKLARRQDAFKLATRRSIADRSSDSCTIPRNF